MPDAFSSTAPAAVHTAIVEGCVRFSSCRGLLQDRTDLQLNLATDLKPLPQPWLSKISMSPKQLRTMAAVPTIARAGLMVFMLLVYVAMRALLSRVGLLRQQQPCSYSLNGADKSGSCVGRHAGHLGSTRQVYRKVSSQQHLPPASSDDLPAFDGFCSSDTAIEMV